MNSNNAKSGLAVAFDNEIKILNNLHRFGWLRAKDLAPLIWQKADKRFSNKEPEFIVPNSSPSALRMAQKTLKRLVQKKLVLTATAPDLSKIYALSQRGVNQLSDFGIIAGSGKDLIRFFSFEQYRHRVIANEIGIASILQGFRIFSEREISQNKWYFNEDGYHGKKADLLILNKDFAWWVEVERSRKNAKDYAHLISWLNEIFSNCRRPHEKPKLLDNINLQKVIFICNPIFESKLLRDLKKTGWTDENIFLRLVFLSSLYTFRQSHFL